MLLCSKNVRCFWYSVYSRGIWVPSLVIMSVMLRHADQGRGNGINFGSFFVSEPLGDTRLSELHPDYLQS